MDLKCPYLEAQGNSREVSDYALRLSRYLDSPLGSEYLKANPQLVGPAFPEYVPVACVAAIANEAVRPSVTRPHPALRPLTLSEAGLVQEALRLRPHLNSRYTLAGLLGWMDLMRLWWARLEGELCLFAEQGGGFFMPLPPLAAHPNLKAVEASWEILRALNQDSAVSRIEALEFSSVKGLDTLGLKTERSELEYLYRREDLAGLRGDRYRRQRWAANRCARELTPRVRPFEAKDLQACLSAYTHWAIGRHQAADRPYPKALLRDGLFFHRRLLMDAASFGLTGLVAEADRGLVAYTLGGWVSKETFVVFLEIADRSLPGLNAFLFRELSRGLENCRFVNAMGDSGLPNLAQNKISYRPCGMVWTETAMCRTWS